MKDSTVAVPDIQIIRRRAQAAAVPTSPHFSQPSASALKISAAMGRGVFNLPTSGGLCTPAEPVKGCLLFPATGWDLGCELLPIRNELAQCLKPVAALKQ